MWNKKYPICILFPPDQDDLGCQGTSEHETDQSKEKSVRRRPVAGQESPVKHSTDTQERTLYLFGRTGREKEEWFQHLLKATQAKGHQPHHAGQEEAQLGKATGSLDTFLPSGIIVSGVAKGCANYLVFQVPQSAVLRLPPNLCIV